MWSNRNADKSWTTGVYTFRSEEARDEHFNQLVVTNKNKIEFTKKEYDDFVYTYSKQTGLIIQYLPIETLWLRVYVD